MPTGTIARLLIDKGFGFIRDEGGIEHFFHRSSVRGAVFELLREGQRVEFTPEDSGKGPRAGDVRLIEVEGSRNSRPISFNGPGQLCSGPFFSFSRMTGGSAWSRTQPPGDERGAADFKDREGPGPLPSGGLS